MVKAAVKSVTSFADILDTPSVDIVRPMPTPVGLYLAMVKGNYEEGKTSNSQTDYADFTLGFLEAQDGVDEDDLATFLKQSDGQMAKLTDKTIKYRMMWHTPGTVYRLKKFLNDLGIPEKDEDNNNLTLRERMQYAPNCQVLIHIRHKAFQDSDSMFAEIDRTLKVQD